EQLVARLVGGTEPCGHPAEQIAAEKRVADEAAALRRRDETALGVERRAPGVDGLEETEHQAAAREHAIGARLFRRGERGLTCGALPRAVSETRKGDGLLRQRRRDLVQKTELLRLGGGLNRRLRGVAPFAGVAGEGHLRRGTIESKKRIRLGDQERR